MNWKKIIIVKWIYIACFGIVTTSLWSQNKPVGDLEDFQGTFLEEYIENIEGEEEFEYNTLVEELKALQSNPINLNTCTYDDLKPLLILNGIQINEILTHIENYGEFMTLYELQTIPSLDLNTITLITPFVTVNESENDYHLSLAEMLKGGESTLYLKWIRILEEQDGYIKDADGKSNYLGDPNRYYMRYKYAYENKMKIGFTADKDAGELFFKGSNKQGFDFYSAYFHLRDYNRTVKDLIIGDFSVSMGQGLILQNSFGGGKSSYVMNIKKGGRDLKSYSSVNEINFYRGVATTLRFRDNLALTIFGSYKDIDGRVIEEEDTTSGLTEELGVSSFSQDGYHRTASEIAKKHTVKEKIVGSRLKYSKNRLQIGLNVLYSKYSLPLDRDLRLYNQFQFRGDKLLNTSFDYSYRYRNFNFFGEVARSDNGGMAYLNGLLISLDKKVDLSLLWRDYGVDYESLNANAFGESTSSQNEKGIYTGLILRPNKHWTISAYADFWRNPWLRFRVDSPGDGQEYLLKLNYYQKRKLTAYFQYKYEKKGLNYDSALYHQDVVVPISLHRLRMNLSYKLIPSISLRSRVELSFYNIEGKHTKGFLVYQDLLFKPKSFPLSFTTRFAIFDTDNFDTRIYTYENDLIYEFYIPFYQNKGLRYYLNMRYSINRSITAEFRVAQTYYANKNTIGSGNEEIKNSYISPSGYELLTGVRRTQLKAQIRYRF